MSVTEGVIYKLEELFDNITQKTWLAYRRLANLLDKIVLIIDSTEYSYGKKEQCSRKQQLVGSLLLHGSKTWTLCIANEIRV